MKIKKKEIIILVLFIIVVSAGAIFVKNWFRDKKQEKEIQALINVEFNGEAGGTENAASGDTQKTDDNVTVTGNSIAVLQIPSQGIKGIVKEDSGTIEGAIGRHPKDRKKMAINERNGKTAITHYRVIERLKDATYMEFKLETGRTHQIRVHMAHIRHAVINDPLYGWKKDHFPIKGQALHSHTLELCHPITGEAMHFEAPVPEDMINCLNLARKESML